MVRIDFQGVDGLPLSLEITPEADGAVRFRLVTSDTWCDAGEHVALLTPELRREIAAALTPGE